LADVSATWKEDFESVGEGERGAANLEKEDRKALVAVTMLEGRLSLRRRGEVSAKERQQRQSSRFF
jgi:hypothetical protein